MADKKNPENPKRQLQEESIITRLKSGAGETLGGVTTYTGLLGRSSKEGSWLLYTTLDMSLCIEVQESDIVHSEALPPEQSPFGGLGGTRVFVRKGAQVTTTRTLTRTHQAGADDEFDLDIRVGQPRAGRPKPIMLAPNTEAANCTDRCPTNNTCTCGQTCVTCQTCRTNCGQPTCEATCGTCNTGCDTCRTCQTCITNCIATCDGLTCDGGNTCNNCGTQSCQTCQGTRCVCQTRICPLETDDCTIFTQTCETCKDCTNTCTNNVPCRC